MQALKVLVISMGVLIAGGIGVIGVTIYKRIGKSGGEVAGAAAGFDITRLRLPRGASVREMRTAGDRLLLRIIVPERGEWVYIIHLGSGKLLGRIAVTEEK